MNLHRNGGEGGENDDNDNDDDDDDDDDGDDDDRMTLLSNLVPTMGGKYFEDEDLGR